MRNWKRLLLYMSGGFFALVVLYVAFYFIFLDLFVDLWWFRSLEYEGYFWLRLLYRFFIGGGVTLAFFSIFFFHFWVASSFLGLNYQDRHASGSTRLIGLFQTGSLTVYTPLSLILAVAVAIPAYREWESVLMFFFGPSAGIEDRVYGNDISFYLFDYPLFQLIQRELLITAILVFLLVAVLYWTEHRIVAGEKRAYPLGAKIHIAVLWGFVTLFCVWGFMLVRFSLLHIDSHEPVFFGPGFVDIRYRLPLIWLAIISFLVVAFAVLIFGFKRDKPTTTLLIVSIVSLAGILGLQRVKFIPELFERFVVRPNPVKAEKPFMEHNIQATLHAYGLDDVETIEFKATLSPELDLAEHSGKEHLKSIPVWDRQLLGDVYQQLQGIRPYYRFNSVDEDRYVINGQKVQVNISAREVNISKLPEAARNWENQYLRYTHGYGAVITPAAQVGGKPIEWYLRDLNLSSDVGLGVEIPDIYYGLEKLKRAIVPNELTIVGLSGTGADSIKNYAGSGGVPVPSLFRKALFAFYFNDEKIFFSTNINTQSKVLFRRNIKQRITTLAPYLALDSDPYLVLTSKGMFWIQDAYTHSNWYPVSKHTKHQFAGNLWNLQKEEFNYIRNSIKVVVDAYDGRTDFYLADPADPVIQAYNRAYPGLFKEMEEMPPELKSHLRYPRDLFYLQMQLYAKYHQQEPELFYQQAETWKFATAKGNEVKPYYLTTELQGCSDVDKFVLISPMTPIGRDNLSALTVAGSFSPKQCEAGYSQRIVTYKFDKEVQVDGPSQISALIAQDPDISEQFTLWDQHGSKVSEGRMILLPVGNSILYVAPVYLISESETKIPELVRIIMGMGSEVVMEKTLEECFKKLEAKLRSNKPSGSKRP